MLAPRPPRPRGLGTADQALTLPLPSQDTGQPPSPSVVTFFLLTGDDTINLSSVSLQLDRVSPGCLCLSSALGTSPGRLITPHPAPAVRPSCYPLVQDNQIPAFRAHLRCHRPATGCGLISCPGVLASTLKNKINERMKQKRHRNAPVLRGSWLVAGQRARRHS